MDYRLEQLRFQLREDPSSRIFFKLGEHLRRSGELDEAVEVLRTGLKQHGRYTAAWVSLGRAQLDNGDADGAQASLERALQLDPENAVAARAMGEAAIIKGDWVTAVKALKRARGLLPQDDALDERIAFVEARLDEIGLLEAPPERNANQVAAAAEITSDEATPTAEPSVIEPPADAEPQVEAGGEPFAVKTGDTGTWEDADDVFAAGWVEGQSPAESEPEKTASNESPQSVESFVEPPPLTDDDLASMVDTDAEIPEGPEPSEPSVVVHEEVFADEGGERGETAFAAPEPEPMPESESEAETVFMPALEPDSEPVIAAEPESVPESEAETVFLPAVEAESVPEPVVESEAEAEFEPVPESEAETAFLPAIESQSAPEPVVEPETDREFEPEPAAEAFVEPEPPPDSWPDPEAEIEAKLEKGVDGLPLPTMTLARLAIDQGDLDLAERTLRGVLARDPDHVEAAKLLETVIAGPPEVGVTAGAKDSLDAKTEALQRWLDAVRLASERLKT